MREDRIGKQQVAPENSSEDSRTSPQSGPRNVALASDQICVPLPSCPPGRVRGHQRADPSRLSEQEIHERLPHGRLHGQAPQASDCGAQEARLEGRAIKTADQLDFNNNFVCFDSTSDEVCLNRRPICGLRVLCKARDRLATCSPLSDLYTGRTRPLASSKR
ncbi:Hypothetical predicted protein [Olea europaea subsp. europaea]|uniref:Uncharacterized protein n=1 Tax=Olea europaea subsp. europaea TaxID=158383 RepID=A0A8S0TNV9_OLEEU|nr:Hypothetical predicted protein [Olea europaea subsp. europaea]